MNQSVYHLASVITQPEWEVKVLIAEASDAFFFWRVGGWLFPP